MRITGQFVRATLAAITVLPTLISALTDADKNTLSREYASTVTKKNIIQFFGGSSVRTLFFFFRLFIFKKKSFLIVVMMTDSFRGSFS